MISFVVAKLKVVTVQSVFFLIYVYIIYIYIYIYVYILYIYMYIYIYIYIYYIDRWIDRYRCRFRYIDL